VCLPCCWLDHARSQLQALWASFKTCLERCSGMQPAVLAAGLVDYLVEAGSSAEERGLALARDIAQARPCLHIQ
jgi:hypothetical protein